MKINVGTSDRHFRIFLSLLIGIAGAYKDSWWGFLAVIPLLTGLLSFCPLYVLFGIHTCSVKKAH